MTTRTDDAVSERSLPAGLYWVGDPCYAYEDHKVWMRLLEAAGYLENPRILDAQIPGDQFIASGTAFGDGCFLDEEGNEYGVDAGLLGAVPVKGGQRCPSGMREVSFSEPFEIGYLDGKVSIGHITIDTDPKPEADECWRCGDEAEEGESYCWRCASLYEDDEDE